MRNMAVLFLLAALVVAFCAAIWFGSWLSALAAAVVLLAAIYLDKNRDDA